MTDADFHQAIQRIRRGHWLHYPAQAVLMGGVTLAAGSRLSGGGGTEPQLATWPALLLLGALVPLVGVLVFLVSRRMRPNLRRPAEQNLRIYQARLFLRDSLLSLLGLPLLASYVVSRDALALVACCILLLALCWLTTPTAPTYQRWLLR